MAQDAPASHAEALRLHKAVGRDNVMIKIPGTAAALPAIESSIASGLPVNVTLLFSQERYAAVVEAYLKGLERRAAQGKDLSRVASVASFFVSRVDCAIDKQLEGALKAKPGAAALLGKAAIANAKLAYQIYKKEFSSPRFAALKSKGAQPQRLLWASTGAKDPRYKDVVYVEELIGPDTVNTMPPATVDAFRDHGSCRPSLEEDVPGARSHWKALAALGVDLDAVARTLEDEGLRSFAQSFETLMGRLAAKRELVLAEAGVIDEGLAELKKAQFSARLWSKDASLWKADLEHQKIIKNSLGWLSAPDAMAAGLGAVRAFAAIHAEGFQTAVVLGMGGSSLVCEVLRRCFEPGKGCPTLEVLDSTCPASVAALEARIDLGKTLFIVSSKSGGTIEPNAMLAYFFDKVSKKAGAKAGRQFAAITDAGTSLEDLARAAGYRKVFLNASDVGGRYSALTLFGLVPAAVMGVDVERLLQSARAAARAGSASVETQDNPALRLGAALGRHARQGRDKLTLSLSPALESFGLWIEQLVAESTGKEGKGIVPVCGEALAEPACYGPDRLFVRIALPGSPDKEVQAKLSALEKAGHPVLSIELHDIYDLGAQFFVWELATAAAGFLLGVDPFDQPDVQKAKDKTRALLEGLDGGALEADTASFRAGGLAAFADEGLTKTLSASRGTEVPLKDALAAHMGRLKPRDYCVVLAYLHEDEDSRRELSELQRRLRRATTSAVCVAFGPRYLHSTGQLYKGGGNHGIFLELTQPDTVSHQVPGQRFTFGTLLRAQARGGFAALVSAKRRVLRLELGPSGAGSLRALVNAASELAQCPS